MHACPFCGASGPSVILILKKDGPYPNVHVVCCKCSASAPQIPYGLDGRWGESLTPDDAGNDAVKAWNVAPRG
jgi:hypothetical protein